MDRVLLIIDDIQYGRHLEMTLRKVGFDVETINNEFNITETLLSFNPDYAITRASGSRLSTLNVGRKLYDAGAKFNGRSILIFPTGFKISADDLSRIRKDIILFEPISTLRLAMHLLNFSGGDFEFIKEKLLKFAITDNQFRNYEQQILKNAGITIDAEIQVVSGMEYTPPANDNVIVGGDAQQSSSNERVQLTQDDAESFSSQLSAEDVDSYESGQTVLEGESESEETGVDAPLFERPDDLTPEAIQKLHDELSSAEMELPLRVDTYNLAVKEVEIDSNYGLKKRQTKNAVNQLRKDLINEKKTDNKSEKMLDDEKVRFAQAMFKRKS